MHHTSHMCHVLISTNVHSQFVFFCLSRRQYFINKFITFPVSVYYANTGFLHNKMSHKRNPISDTWGSHSGKDIDAGLQPWRWRQYVPLKCWRLSSGPCCVITWKTNINIQVFYFTIPKPSNYMYVNSVLIPCNIIYRLHWIHHTGQYSITSWFGVP
jgi:hypothetical protein